MPHLIETEIHNVLLDIAPDGHDEEEQAEIVTEAAYICERASRTATSRTSTRRPDPVRDAKVHEARIMDSLLQAMGHLSDWTEATDESAQVIDGFGLTPDQIVRAAESIPTHRTRRYAVKGFGSDMDLMNFADDDLDAILNGTLVHDPNGYSIEDGEERHCPSLYDPPGLGRHRSDSLIR